MLNYVTSLNTQNVNEYPERVTGLPISSGVNPFTKAYVHVYVIDKLKAKVKFIASN